jgi:hypothetical protein
MNTERQAIDCVIGLGKRFGYGTMISHLQHAWAKRLIEYGVPHDIAWKSIFERKADDISPDSNG